MNIIKDSKEQEINSFDELDYSNITIDEMNILKTKLAHLIEKTKSAFFKTIDSKIDELLNLVFSGTESGLLSDEETWEFIDSKLNDKKQGEKVRIHQNANE